ncbi:uncharacterized protein B0I36DRAFT_374543 [Microdochium trichocladiopsis]|uniref:Uncharacterized protein n=1 Tax=Microdochium trichocladiopsis TaxID=1682393 RepID=A0A9P8Y610_9PEZI|nr:uncharacterized protein B0I36DRAFT_374543 [Microdochium trichocladiopsis]KAH7028791.1 hypothetical protein B0I36DRAFT_374543 [Microdochium trichocladiopsis]
MQPALQANGLSSKTEERPGLLNVSANEAMALFKDRVQGTGAVPGLHLNTVRYRYSLPDEQKIRFRVRTLQKLRRTWKNDETEAKFLNLVRHIESDGCALFGGLVDTSVFERLVLKYDEVLEEAGNKTFMHSYVNFAHHPAFLKDEEYTDAFGHPLLICLIAYLMGGPVRVIDLRGKDTNPININAQDDMLHVDNTPFKEEYKILLTWRRGKAQGASGQNFTFLPGTHKGNRDILVDNCGDPWSTERDSLFVSHEALDGLFQFQETIGVPRRVIEVNYPEKPLAAVFPAGSLVHHRYRNMSGSPRSCIIAAFHLAVRNPGELIHAKFPSGSKRSLLEFLVGFQDGDSDDEFTDIICDNAKRIEEMIWELSSPSAESILVDLQGLAILDFDDTVALTEFLSTSMFYDKHGLLHLILYEDGHEEIRKPARKRIGEMQKDTMALRLAHGCPTSLDLLQPETMRVVADAIVEMAKRPELYPKVPHHNVTFELASLRYLLKDLGEAIFRCEGTETFLCTSLFLFWAGEEIVPYLKESDQAVVRPLLGMFLRNYAAFLLLIEGLN